MVTEGYNRKAWRQLRRELMQRHDSCCYWCNKPVIWYPNKGGKLPLNFATIDHLYSKLDSRRRHNKFVFVLACKKCNEARAREEEKQLDLAELRRRAGGVVALLEMPIERRLGILQKIVSGSKANKKNLLPVILACMDY